MKSERALGNAGAEPRARNQRDRGHQRINDRTGAAQLEQARPFPRGEHDDESDQRAERAHRREQRDRQEHCQQDDRRDDTGF
ncbi:hypothetical protein GGD41_007800 [Paraburkholderia bryophila]|uniref:Uncharacterized protein n=1 Tax=Paraburkholderia bryophila TaxID=420952 RepID=A0A7Y9WHM5_9BURK|nr:hypothetical protein [Paraburkholderia bryophila]